MLHKLIEMPNPGDLVVFGISGWYGAKECVPVLVAQRYEWQPPEETMIVQLKKAQVFWGPSSGPPREGYPEVLSVSGGPFSIMRIGDNVPDIRPIGHASLPCWHWKGLPCAGGGVEYTRKVRLWFAPILIDNAEIKRREAAAISQYCEHYIEEEVDE